MIRKPQYKIARRLGEKIFPKTQTQKFALRSGRKATTTGKRPKQKTEYGQQFLEKQKVKLSYGLLEKQFVRYVKEAREHGRTNPVLSLYTRLETRLDNVVFRMGFAPSRAAARQIVSHGHICINGTRTTVPSYNVLANDTITLRAGSKASPLFKDLEQKLKNHKSPDWLLTDPTTHETKVQGLPTTIQQDVNLNFNAVLELYSRA